MPVSSTGADRGSIAIDGPTVNLTRQLDEGFVLRIDWRIDALPSGPILVTLGGASLDLASQLQTSTLGKKIETSIPLRCFNEAGADLRAVGTPLRLTANRGFVATLRDVRIEPVGRLDFLPHDSSIAPGDRSMAIGAPATGSSDNAQAAHDGSHIDAPQLQLFVMGCSLSSVGSPA